jgi:signal transduction histidine kinase
MAQLASAARATYVDVRAAILGLRLSTGSDQPAASILRDYAAQVAQLNPAEIIVEADATAEALILPADVELQVVRIVQEALANIRKHASAANAWVRLRMLDGRLIIAIEDDGKGFDLKRPARDKEPHYGLKMMAERIESVGGQIRVESWPGRGTRLTLSLPPNQPALGLDQAPYGTEDVTAESLVGS